MAILYIRQLKQLVVALRIGHQVEWLGWKNRTEKYFGAETGQFVCLIVSQREFCQRSD